MKWALAVALLATSSFYLYDQYAKLIVPPVNAVAPPIKPRPLFAASEIKKVRASTRHYNAGVRWTAMELLFSLGDPEAVHYLEKAIASDPDPGVRLKAVKMLGSRTGAAGVHGLTRGLRDIEKDIRLMSLEALASLGEPAALPWIADVAVKDYDPEVRAAALRTIGGFQDKRRRDFEALAAQLRHQYEAAVQRSLNQNR